MALATDNFETQEYKINIGPQHPSTHGVYRAVVTLNGEYIVNVENIIGYMHRGMEKLAESRTYAQYAPYPARFDYVASLLNCWGYVASVEKLMNIEVPERAEFIRVVMGELQRIASHLVMLGSFSIDLNSTTGWMYAFTARESILDVFELVTGSRMINNYMTIGGVAADIPEGFLPALEKALESLYSRLNDFETLIAGNELFQGRTKNIGVITPEMALEYGMTGPNLRASGVDLDLRKKAPYSVYDRFTFDVPTLKNGDAYDRLYIRILEIRESVRIIKQAAYAIPEGPISAKVPRIIKPPVGEVYHQIEGAKGALGYYIVSDGTTKPYRLHAHGPSFVNIGIIPEIAKGITIQDFVSLLASFDFLLGEVDR